MQGRRRETHAATSMLVLASLSGLCVPAGARASWMESLVMPGEVATRHAQIEQECEKCHSPFNKAGQDQLCRACHTEVAADGEAHRGYHGRAPAVREARDCKSCHSEHQGRAARIVRLDPETFDHQVTDLPLRGRHERVPCEGCHTIGGRYRDAPADCSDCHARRDPHEGCLGAACAKCHAEASWTETRFAHDATDFPLDGRHREVRCDGCHANKRYSPTATSCSACHARDDSHEGRLGTACDKCHTARAWSATAAFDHGRDARFPLLGRHARVPCEGCHPKGTARGTTPTACQGCHAEDDVHRGRFGRACDTCHTALEWRRHTFEHEQRTRYPLRGRHGELRCADCHTGELYAQRLATTCVACHRDDDVHRGHEGTRCESCHDERGWRRDVLFDHDLTRFPLLGVHGRIPCGDCHASPAFKEVARECVECHRDDDVHRGRLGPPCSTCHNPATWAAWDFNHTTQTAFPLDGAHETIACVACHGTVLAGGVDRPRTCVSCHEADDVHRGQFGALCGRCHQTSAFSVIRELQ